MKNTVIKKYNVVVFSLISIMIGFIVGAIILAVAGYNPIQAYIQMLVGVFSRPKYITLTIIKAIPLILTGSSITFAFRTGLFNIGAEGQFIIGTVAAALAGYFFKLPPIIHPIIVISIAMIAASIWGGIAGLLKAKFGVYEVSSTIMLNWIALYLHNYVITIPSVQKRSNISHDIQPTASLVVLEQWKNTEQGRAFLTTPAGEFLKADLNLGIVITIIAAVIFGRWKPQGVLVGALVFGAAQALVITLGGTAINISSQILAMLPYVLTLIILMSFKGNTSSPKALGQSDEKGQR